MLRKGVRCALEDLGRQLGQILIKFGDHLVRSPVPLQEVGRMGRTQPGLDGVQRGAYPMVVAHNPRGDLLRLLKGHLRNHTQETSLERDQLNRLDGLGIQPDRRPDSAQRGTRPVRSARDQLRSPP